MADKEKRTRIAIRVFLVAIFLIPLALVRYKSSFGGETFLEITVLDVGQGDAILIKTPHNKKILIDGGPDGGVVGKIPQDFPFFSCYVDIVLSTHSHSDHITGINAILKRCATPLFIINDIGPLENRPNENVAITPGFSGDKFSLDGVNFYILWPPKDFSSSDLNNMSIVVLMEYKGFKALFTGDAESDILVSVVKDDIDFLKSPHHGSYDEGLETLLSKVTPAIMAISVGKNSFGHPSLQVLGIADSADIEVFRTDEDGDIVVKVDSAGRVLEFN
ncbi:MAG: MBL fold metallo-hydrolase [Patescibacteria group bacterium]|nr:MBL fold metallo-hydrolase [Patescibacteria group bacterium]